MTEQFQGILFFYCPLCCDWYLCMIKSGNAEGVTRLCVDCSEWITAVHEKFGKEMLHYCTTHTKNIEDALQAYQDFIVRISNTGQELLEVDLHSPEFPRFLRTYLAYLCLESYKHERIRTTTSLFASCTGSDGIVGIRVIDTLEQQNDVGFDGELRDMVREAVKRLPDQERRVIELQYDDQCTYREIGRILGCSAVTVKNIRTRAIKKLENALQPYQRSVAE